MPVAAESFLNEVFFSALEPPQHDLEVWQWADDHRILSGKASKEPGRFKTSRTPYAKEPMAELSIGSPTTKVVLMWGSQLGKTEIGNNFTGYVIDYAPSSMLVVQPTVGLARRHSKQRVEPMIRDCEVLSEKIPPARRRDSGNTALEKEFPGGILIFGGAEAASGLASMPIKNLMLDEVDRFPSDVEKEGDPVDLAIARTKTYGRSKKIFVVSTPTIKGASRIEMEYELSDQRQFHVPCPHCHEKQVLRFGDGSKKFGLVWDGDNPKSVVYICEHCGSTIEEHHKTYMLEHGVWIPKYPERPVRGYHLNSLYSPVGMYSWEDVVSQWLESKDKPERLKAFVNTVLAETWEEKGESPDHEKLYRRRQDYKTGVVPEGAYILTAGVDVQKNRIEVFVYGWGARAQRWAVDYVVLKGDTTEQDVWNQLDRLLEKEYPHSIGGGLKIDKLAIDTGYNTQTVYNWLLKQDAGRVMGVKGHDTMPMMLGRPSTVNVVSDGVTVSRSLQIWMIGVGHAKSELFGYLKKDEPLDEGDELPYGWCHYPEWELDFFKGLCSEKLCFVNGKAKWIKTFERNEPLDTSVYARVAAAARGLDSWDDADWAVMRDSLLLRVKGSTNKPSAVQAGGYIYQDRESYI